jgi:methionyl aminopeptidase
VTAIKPIDEGKILRLKDQEWLMIQKKAGRAVSHALRSCVDAVRNKSKITPKDLERIAAEHIDIHGPNGCIPTFLGYRNFPAMICVSVNNALVHGVPDDRELQDGDVITFDMGATLNGVIADAAYTCVRGDPKDDRIPIMLKTCQEALHAAIKAIKVDEQIGIIGHTIWNHVRYTPFGLVTAYGGHGIDTNELHATPFVPNKSKKNEGVRIQPGLSIAIEPMMTLTKNTNTKTLPDKWTIVTKDVGCHFEHSVTLDENGIPHTITEHDMITGEE